MERRIRNIVFDLGGVLVDWNPRYLYRKIFSDEQKMEDFLSRVCNQDWNEKQDAGRPFSVGVSELLAKFPQYKAEIEAYDTRWEEMLNGSISETVRILEQVKAARRHRVLALSNWSSEKFTIAEREFSFLSLFEETVVSGRVGLKKPDPQIFNLLCERCSISPRESLFIDDSFVNIESAQSLGFHTIHFTSGPALHSRLVEMGVV